MRDNTLLKVLKVELERERVDRVTIARLINTLDKESILTLDYGPITPDYENKIQAEGLK